jgi:quinol monooxygenase YgiN
MSEDEAEGDVKKLEDNYADELGDDDGFDEPSAKKSKKEVKPVWTLFVKLTFDSAEKVETCKRLVSSYAQWMKENEPTTLSYQLMTSDSDPLQVCILERYQDKSYAYAVAHKVHADKCCRRRLAAPFVRAPRIF